MTEVQSRFPVLRAPVADRAVLAEPPLTRAAALLEENRRRLDHAGIAILGRPLGELRRELRQSAVAAGHAYLSEAGQSMLRTAADIICAGGHQPELFHPGVWVKNFALSGLGRRHGGIPLNVIIDNDVPKATSLRLPVWRGADGKGVPTLAHLLFDYWHGDTPYEERPVQDEAVFSGVADQVEKLTNSWNFKPLLPAFWTQAMGQAQRTPLLGERFAAARRHFERSWGCQNLEVPLSRILVLEPAGRFICHVLGDLERFQVIYNEVLAAYRRRHGVRGRQRPVPDLLREGDWLETPFWAWQAGERRRHRLFARGTAGAIQLRAGKASWPTLAADDPLANWRQLTAAGYKIRTRALTTTMFLRLFLADLFVHGIGGGIYDEVTDEIIRRFFGIEAPVFIVLSATLLLPFAHARAAGESCVELAQQARDLRCNPQRHLDVNAPPEARQLAQTKSRRLASPAVTRTERRQRFAALRAVTRELQTFVEPKLSVLLSRLQSCLEDAAAGGILNRRDFAFCLYPETLLREFMAQFLSV